MKGDRKKEASHPKPLAALVQIQLIRLRELSASSRTILPNQQLHFQLKLTHDASILEKSDDAFAVAASMDATLLGPVDRPMQMTEAELSALDVYASVKVTYELKYKLPDKTSAPKSEELNSFAKANGIFNAWPYLRECVQDTYARMNFPAVTLPLFRVVASSTGPDRKT